MIQNDYHTFCAFICTRITAVAIWQNVKMSKGRDVFLRDTLTYNCVLVENKSCGCYFTWFAVFFCRSDKVGLRLVSLQQSHALSMTLPERGREEGECEGIRQPLQRQRSGRSATAVWGWTTWMNGRKSIMNLGEFRANSADRKRIFMNNSLCKDHDPLLAWACIPNIISFSLTLASTSLLFSLVSIVCIMV